MKPKVIAFREVTGLDLPIQHELPKTKPGFGRIVLMGDLHYGVRNVLRIGQIVSELRKTTPELMLVNTGDDIEGGMYPEQFFHLMKVINHMRQLFSVIGNHTLDMEDKAVMMGLKSLWQSLKQATEISSFLKLSKHIVKQLYYVLLVKWKGKNILLSKAFEEANYPILSLNLDFEKTSSLGKLKGKKILPYTIEDVQGHKVVFIGVTTPSISHELDYHQRQGYESTISVNPKPINDQIDAMISEVRKQYPAVPLHFVLASHLGRKLDEKIATPDIELILGGHTHNEVLERISHANGTYTDMIHTGIKGYKIGVIDLNIGSNGRLDPKIELIDVGQVKGINDDYAGFSASDFQIKNKKVGALGQALDMRNKSTQPSALMNLITDACRAQLKSDVVFSFSGNIRDGLPEGTVTETDLENMLPWPSPLYTFETTGQKIIDMLNFSLGISYKDSHKVLLLHPSGLTYEINEHGKLENIQVLRDGHWEPIQPDKKHNVSLPKYMATGGVLGFPVTIENNSDFAISSATDLSMLEAYLGQVKMINPDTAHRIRIHKEAPLIYNDSALTY